MSAIKKMDQSRYVLRYEGETEIMYISALAALLVRDIEDIDCYDAPEIKRLQDYCEKIQVDPEFRRSQYEQFKAQSR